MGKKWGDGKPTANTIDLLTYMFVNAKSFTLKDLADRYDCSKQTILGYFENINNTCFGKIKKLDIKRDKESLYSLEVDKDVIIMFEKRKKNILKDEEELKQLAKKSREDKKIKDKSSSKKAEDQISAKKKSNISKTKSAKVKKDEKWQKHQKTKPTRKDKK